MEKTLIEDFEYVLLFKHGEVARRITVSHHPFVLGRGSSADLDLETDRASRRHAEIRREAGAWTIVDLGSRNGTRVNGETVTARTLRIGDVITVGAAELEWQEVAVGRISLGVDTVVLPEE